MASVRLVEVNKVYQGRVPSARAWYQLWRPSSVPQDVHVVKGVSLEVRDGEFLVLVGPSGCGKSTTLRMVAGLEEVTSGEIFIGPRRVNDVLPKDRDIAMVFQSYALYPHMSVYENMAFGLKLRKLPKAEIEARVRGAAELLGLEGLLIRKPKELSGGQRQRVAMGRAIVRRPQVFLMDEPLSNLDARLRVQMRAELQKLHRQLGVTTLYVTHDQTEAMTLGDRIVLMKGGTIQQIDTPLNLYERPANQYVAGFIGSPAMNFLPARLERGQRGLEAVGGGFRVALSEGWIDPRGGRSGGEVILGIRPEDLYDPRFSREEAPLAPLKGVVEVLEPLGAEVHLTLDCAGVQVVARVDAHTSARPGEPIELLLDTRRIHLFDPGSEAAWPRPA